MRAAFRLTCVLIVGWAKVASAVDFDGVQPAAMDQPRINLVLRRSATEPPLGAKVAGEQTFNVEAFLDTGASSIMISPNTAEQLGIQREKTTGPKAAQVRFEDVGVGGGDRFAVSEPLFLSIAPSAPGVDVDNGQTWETVYSQTCGPMRAEVGPVDSKSDFLAALAMGDLDVAGMPAMADKVVVMNPKDVNNFTDKIRTFLYPPDSHEIPRTRWHVKLSYGMFKQFTTVTPASALGPAIAANPIIGPNPLRPVGDKTPPITVTQGGKTSSGSWLLDTGAVTSMISQKQAATLGVSYAAGTFGTDHPKLDGVPAHSQFTMEVGGVGGAKKSAGFYLDKLTLRTKEGEPINFLRVPVLVADITLKDSTSGQTMVLDGVFGMNFLVASAKVDTGALGTDFDATTAGAFRWIVFDQPHGLLGLD